MMFHVVHILTYFLLFVCCCCVAFGVVFFGGDVLLILFRYPIFVTIATVKDNLIPDICTLANVLIEQYK